MAREFAQLPGVEIIERIGRGAGALLYEGFDTAKQRRVAIKHVVRHGPQDDRFIEQAEGEFALAQKLNHPFLRKCYDMVRIRRWLKTAELFLLMEFVDGVRLEDQQPSTLAGKVQLFLDVADGLNAMHKVGFAHADIKPNNILLSRKGVKIIDYGQSCPLGHTKERVQGTPDFMAPEQVHRLPIDQRTDVFNLGATMYWAMTGKWYRTLMNVGQTGQKRIEVDARSNAAPPHELDPGIPVTLSQLILDCCEPKKEDRPRDMRDVLTRLDIVLHMIRKSEKLSDSGRKK